MTIPHIYISKVRKAYILNSLSVLMKYEHYRKGRKEANSIKIELRLCKESKISVFLILLKKCIFLGCSALRSLNILNL